MEFNLTKFYDDNFIPGHVRLLLGLHGVVYLRDLVGFGIDDIEEIEQTIQTGGYNDKVDFTSKVNRIKYLGSDVVDMGKFRFTSIDKKKLRAIDAAATTQLATKLAKQKESSKESSNSSQSQKSPTTQ